MSSIDTINGNLLALGFKNTSVTAIDEQIAIAVGQLDDNVIAEMANTTATIQNILISQYGYLKGSYYTAQALYFQFGYNLVINTAINPVTNEPYLNLIYPTIDTTANIIKQAAFQQLPSGNVVTLFLKIATQDPLTGLLIPLSSQQLIAFTSYMNNFEAPGLPLNIVNEIGNVLNFNAIATYQSAYNYTTLQANIATALTGFLTASQFNGEFYTGSLQQYIINNVPGMVDFFVSNTTLDGAPFSGFVALSSGYFNYAINITNNITYNGIQS